MKKVLLAVMVLAIGATMAHAQVTQVLSQNAVGYVKVDVRSNGYALASVPFFDLEDAEYTIPEVIGDQLTGGNNFGVADNIIKWDAASGGYIIFWKNPSGVWQRFPITGEATNTLSPGEGFWIKNAHASNQTVYLMGEVPDASTAPSNNIQLVEGFQFASFPYPAEIAITNLNLSNSYGGNNFGVSDQIIKWDNTSQAYTIYWKKGSDGKWYRFPLATPTTDTLKPGEGAWYKRYTGQGGFVWTEEKPYTWP